MAKEQDNDLQDILSTLPSTAGGPPDVAQPVTEDIPKPAFSSETPSSTEQSENDAEDAEFDDDAANIAELKNNDDDDAKIKELELTSSLGEVPIPDPEIGGKGPKPTARQSQMYQKVEEFLIQFFTELEYWAWKGGHIKEWRGLMQEFCINDFRRFYKEKAESDQVILFIFFI